MLIFFPFIFLSSLVFFNFQVAHPNVTTSWIQTHLWLLQMPTLMKTPDDGNYRWNWQILCIVSIALKHRLSEFQSTLYCYYDGNICEQCLIFL